MNATRGGIGWLRTGRRAGALRRAGWAVAAAVSVWLGLATPTWAVPAAANLFRVKQPDGTQVTLRLQGDEAFAWHQTSDGYAAVRNTTDGWWYYARPAADGSGFVATSVRVGRGSPRAAGVTPNAPLPAAAVRKATERATAQLGTPRGPQAPKGAPGLVPPAKIPAEGTVRNIVLMACFSDHWDSTNSTVLAANGRPRSEYVDLFNQVGYTADGAHGSVRDYFSEVSYGKLTVQSTLTSWVQLPNNEAYYGGNDGSGNDLRPREMVVDAINAADAAGFDFSQGDGDGDGWVDMLTIIHSGGDESWGGNPANCIWSHKWALSASMTVDGVSMYVYNTGPALRFEFSTITRIGVVCHEMTHFLGLPDLYDYSGTTEGAGRWCLMGAGSWGTAWDGSGYPMADRPAHMSAWCKAMLGFIKPTEIHSQTGISLPRVETNPTVHMLRDGTSNDEYFLIENRQATGFDTNLPAGGICIWHIDRKSGNNDLGTWPHPVVKLEEADGDNSLGSGAASIEAGDVWTSTNGLAGGFRDQTGDQDCNSMRYQPAHAYNRANNATYYTYNTLSNFSASGATMTYDAQTLRTRLGDQTSMTGNYTLNWAACTNATKYELQEGTPATLTSFSDGAEDENTMYENWYLLGDVQRRSDSAQGGSFCYVLQLYDKPSDRGHAPVQQLVMKQPFRVTGSTTVTFYYLSKLSTGYGYLKARVSGDNGLTWTTLGTYSGNVGTWTLVTLTNAQLQGAVGLNNDAILGFVFDCESGYGWDTFPSYGFALDTIQVNSTQIPGVSGWATVDNNVAPTSYSFTSKAAGQYAYRVRAYANAAWQAYSNAGIVNVVLPEVTVLGNGNSIADGDNTPSAADDTSFGTVNWGDPAVTRIYTVRNDGTAALTLGVPSLPAGYTLTNPLVGTLAPGAFDTFAVTLGTAVGGTFAGDVSFSTNDGDGGDGVENPFNFRITGRVLSPPEIKVEGNGQDIADGETTATLAEDTSFGVVNQGAPVVQRTYTVRNLGEMSLTLGAVSLPTGFTLFEGLSASIAGGGSDTFTVQMETATAGTFTGQVSIPNNDSDENPFNFAIAGAVLSPPEIEVRGLGVLIVDGDATPAFPDGTDFGTANQDAPSPARVYVVRNLGGQTLTLGGVSLPAGYVLTDGLSGVLPGGAADSFTVALATGTPGTFSGQISFANNDAHGGDGIESPFNFSITGRVLSYPEIEVRGSGLVIVDGDATPSAADDTDFGSANQGAAPLAKTYTVRNLGDQTLALGAVSVPAGFVLSEPLAGALGAGGADTFTVRLGTATAGTFSGQVSVATNDANENPTNFAITGRILSPPEVEVTGNGLVIVDGDATPSAADDTAFGTVDQGAAAVARTYTVRNLGDQALTLGAVSLPAGFVLSEPLAGSLAGGAADTFTVTLGTAVAGSFTGWVSFSTNDADGGDGVENPADFAIAGRVLSYPEVEVRGNGLVIADGDTTPSLTDDTDFGAVNQGEAPVDRTYTVTNLGEQALTLGAVSVPPGYALVEPLDASLAGGASDSFTVRLGTGLAGTYAGQVAFGSNDADGGDGVENPVNFAITGRVTVPEMDVYGNGLMIADDDTTPSPADDTDFGAGDVGGSGVAHTFTIRNPGTGELTLDGSPRVSIEGANPADFSVTVLPAATVAGGASTSFEVTFVPLATGLRSASIAIANNDPDEAPYSFAIQGTGYVNQPVAVLAAWPNPAACSQLVTFSAVGSYIDRPDRSIVLYEWDFDSDGVYDDGGPAPVSSHAFAQFGLYVVTLRVTDDNLPPRTATTALPVWVNQGNQAPVADAGGPYTVAQGSDLALDGSASSDPDTGCGDSLVRYAWDLGCDGTTEYFGVSPTVPWADLAGLPLGVPVPLCLWVMDGFSLTDVASTTLTVTGGTTLRVRSDPEINVPTAGTHPGTTEYSVSVPNGTPVALTAPWLHAGRQFRRWKDPADATLSYAATYAFVMAGNTMLIAEYGVVTDYYVDDDGDDALPGTSPMAPMRTLQGLLDRYPDIGAGCSVRMAPGTYPENVVLGGNHGGLLIAGAGDGADPATATHLVGQGGTANLDVLLITAGGPGAAAPTTVGALRVTSPGGLDAGPLYGGITLDATPSSKADKGGGGGGVLQYVRLECLTVSGVTGDGAGCGLLITGSSPYADLVANVAVAGCQMVANDGAGILVTGVQLAGLDIGAGSCGHGSVFLANGGSGLLLDGEPASAKDVPQFSDVNLCATTFGDNAPYDMELLWTSLDIDATHQVAFMGAATAMEIEARLWHQVDDPLLGLITYTAPSLAGNRLSWDRTTFRFTFNGMQLIPGALWYPLGSPSGAEIQIRVIHGTGNATASVVAIDLTGGDHSDAIAVTLNNSLCYRWSLRGMALTRLSEISTLGATQQIATYDALLNRTTYGRTAKPGLWLLAHDVLSWDRILLAIVAPGP